jgi:hypothetical protein
VKHKKTASRKALDQPALGLENRVICCVPGCNARASIQHPFDLINLPFGSCYGLCDTHAGRKIYKSQVI